MTGCQGCPGRGDSGLNAGKERGPWGQSITGGVNSKNKDPQEESREARVQEPLAEGQDAAHSGGQQLPGRAL